MSSTEETTVYQGRVKWFNNKAGYGFITVIESNDESIPDDVFAHHSAICVSEEQYKYLVQGEYVQFELRQSDNSAHPYQAGNIRGVMEGMLMCETRATMRKENTNNSTGSADGKRRSQRRPRVRGSGPRDRQQNQGEGNWKMSSESQ